MKRFLIWFLVLVGSGFANLNFVSSGMDVRSIVGCDSAICKSDLAVAAFVGLFRLRQADLLSTSHFKRSGSPICSTRLSASDERSLDSPSPLRGPAFGGRRGLSLDWVSESKRPASFSSRPTKDHTSQRPGFAVPSSWREGVEYELGVAHTFTRGEAVAVLFSDGSLRFGRIERTPREADSNAEYIVQVRAAPHVCICCVLIALCRLGHSLGRYSA